jgi:hypothetical protein
MKGYLYRPQSIALLPHQLFLPICLPAHAEVINSAPSCNSPHPFHGCPSSPSRPTKFLLCPHQHIHQRLSLLDIFKPAPTYGDCMARGEIRGHRAVRDCNTANRTHIPSYFFGYLLGCVTGSRRTRGDAGKRGVVKRKKDKAQMVVLGAGGMAIQGELFHQLPIPGTP